MVMEIEIIVIGGDEDEDGGDGDEDGIDGDGDEHQ